MRAQDCNIAKTTDGSALTSAVELLASDGLVALPTETVYGLAASIESKQAIDRVYSTKGRPSGHPLIVHLADEDDLTRYGQNLTTHALTCARHCWPGPFTMLVERTTAVPDNVVGGGPLVALRVPANTFTRMVIRQLGHAIVAPSANLYGHVSPTTAQHVCADLGRSVDLIVDDGACPIGVESTIIDCSGDQPLLLRAGGMDVEVIESLLGTEVLIDDGPARAPGMLSVHYQPRAEVIVAQDADAAHQQLDAITETGRRGLLLDHFDQAPLYASTLYAQMRRADDEKFDFIVAVLPDNRGLGRAIRDRLIRAAAR